MVLDSPVKLNRSATVIAELTVSEMILRTVIEVLDYLEGDMVSCILSRLNYEFWVTQHLCLCLALILIS